MDSIFNKIKTSVTEVLPGNPLSSEFNIQNQVIGSCGPELMWKIYNAQKKSTKEHAAVFVFEKKQIDKLSKIDKNEILTSIKKGVQQLTRIRHPKVLSVLHPVEENRDCLAFATEPVLVSLANVLGDTKNAPNIQPSTSLEEVEIKYGLLQLLEALTFLHSDVKAIHANIHPSSIILNDKRIWKLSGFDFFIQSTGSSGGFPCPGWRSGALESTQPCLDFMAPEWILHSTCSPKSDMYSLGVLIYALYNQGKPVYQCHSVVSNCKQHLYEMKRFRSDILRNVPDGLKDSVKSLLSTEPADRPDAKSLSKMVYFEDVAVLSLMYLDTLVQRDNLQKSQYFKSLPCVLKQMPILMSLYRVLPILFSECSNVDMIPFVLQNILTIAEKCNKDVYSQYILPGLIPILKLKQPIQIPFMILKNMTLLLNKTSESDTRKHLLPMLVSSIDVDNNQLQELCLDILPSFSQMIDKEAMRTSVIPRIRNLCISTQLPATRVKCLLCIGKMMTHMDKWFVLDEVLLFLNQIPSREPAVLMTILGIYKTAFTNKNLGIPREHLATKSLPYLITLSVDHSLSKQQFQMFMAVIKDMLSALEKEQLAKHDEQKEKTDEEAKSLNFDEDTVNDDKLMMGFLKEVGLSSSNHSSPSHHPKPQINKAPGGTNTTFQVKDLTASLGDISVPLSKPPLSSDTFSNSPFQNINQTQTAKPNPASNCIDWTAPIQPAKSTLGSESGIDWSKSSTNRTNIQNSNNTHESANWFTASPPSVNMSGPLQNNSMRAQPQKITSQGNMKGPLPGNTLSIKLQQNISSNTNTWSAGNTASDSMSGWSIASPPQNNIAASQGIKNPNSGWSFSSSDNGNNSWSFSNNSSNNISEFASPSSSSNFGLNSSTQPEGNTNFTGFGRSPILPHATNNKQQGQMPSKLSQKDLNDLLG